MLGRRDLLEEISALDHLHFSRRARRRARWRRVRARLTIGGWLLTTGLAAFLGVRAPDGLGLFREVEDRVLSDAESGALESGSSENGPPSRPLSDLADDAFRVARTDASPSASPSSTPSSSPSPTASLIAASSADAISHIIYDAAAEFGISGEYLLSVAYCESTLNPNAYNAGGYHGLFQFDFTTWNAYGYGDIYNPVAQARTAARLLAAGQSSRWPNCA